MDNKQLAEVAKILGVSEDSISAMDDEIKNSMTAVFEQVAVKNDEDKKAVFEALDNLWQKGSIYIELAEVAKSTGITTETLRSLDYETQQTIVYEFMMDSSQTARFYDLVNNLGVFRRMYAVRMQWSTMPTAPTPTLSTRSGR